MTRNKILKDSGEAFLHATGKLPFQLTNDYLFRAVLQENHEVLMHLIGALLDIPYESISSCTITNPIVLGESIDDKTVIMDVRILLNNDTLLNLEMQMGDLSIWPSRSMYYLCKLYCNLERGHNYDTILPSIHIGILPRSPFEEMQEFYSEYLMMNKANHHIFTGNFSLRMLCLNQIDNVSEDIRTSELYNWAKLFVATTWEEIQMLAKQSDVIKDTAATMYQLTAEDKIRLQCEARERYEHDIASYLHEGEKRGREIGEKRGREIGEKVGEKRGREIGEKIGEKRGETRAANQLNRLNQLLIEDGRMDELKRSTTDPELQEKLLREYHLIT